MLNLFKHQWLPDYIREYILKKFPTKHFKVTFEINGMDIPMDQVVGDERNIKLTTPEDLWTAEMFLGRDALGAAKESVKNAGIEFGEMLDELADKVSDAAAKVKAYAEKQEEKK